QIVSFTPWDFCDPEPRKADWIRRNGAYIVSVKVSRSVLYRSRLPIRYRLPRFSTRMAISLIERAPWHTTGSSNHEVDRSSGNSRGTEDVRESSPSPEGRCLLSGISCTA